MNAAERALENDEDTFSIKGITAKESAKILLHVFAHPIKGTKPKVKFPLPDCWTVEEHPKCITSYKDGILWVSSNKDNFKLLKERFYHYMQCTCKIDRIVEQAKNFQDAIDPFKKELKAGK